MKNKISEDAKQKVINFFASMADETRLKILLAIAKEPRCVTVIHEFVGKEKMTLSAVSHQLKSLSDMGIVKNIKKGKEKYYELSENFCWCILRDAFKQFGNNIEIKCKKCENKMSNSDEKNNPQHYWNALRKLRNFNK